MTVYLNGDLKVVATDYTVNAASQQITWMNTPYPATSDVVDVIRKTNPTGATNSLQYCIEELYDALAYLGAGGAGMLWSATALTPQFQVSGDSRLYADPLSANQHGFNKAAFSFQKRAPGGSGSDGSFAVGWYSVVFTDGAPATDKHTNSALGIYAESRMPPAGDGSPQAAVGITAVSEVARLITSAKCEAIVASAKEVQSTAATTFSGTNYNLTFTATQNGIDSNSITVILANSSTVGVSVGGSYPNITITLTGLSNYTAAQYATLLYTSQLAATYVDAIGSGTSTSIPTGSQMLSLGKATNGKLVCFQASLVPWGGDTGAGPTPLGSSNYNYGYTANSNGGYPGYAAFMAKSTDADDPTTKGKGWYNGFAVDADCISNNTAAPSRRGRAFWYVGRFAVVPYTSGTTASSLTALGHDAPLTPLHIALPESVKVRIQNTATTSSNTDVGTIQFYSGSGTGTLFADVTAHVNQVSPNDGRITISNVSGGSYAARLHVAGGVYTPNASRGDLGLDSINAGKLCVNGAALTGTVTRTDTSDFSLTIGSDAPEVFHDAALTAIVAITLSNTNAVDGARFRIVRLSNSTGSSLRVKNGTGATLKNISAGNWADFTYRTSVGWTQSAGGTL